MGLRELRVDAQAMLAYPHPFQYDKQAEKNIWLVRVWQRIGALRSATARARLPLKAFLVAAHKLWSWLVLARVIVSFDAYIFLFGQTITNTAFELWLLRRLGRKIVFVYVGSDSRPPYMDGGRFPGMAGDDLPSVAMLRNAVRRCKRKIRMQERYADYVVNSPATAHFHERPYINWFALGLPKALKPQTARSGVTSAETSKLGSMRILHSPSNALVKGTTEIINALDRLRQKGLSIELVRVQNMPNDAVLRELAHCDFIVDQLYADTPLAAFATEAAFFGKPAVVGGYFARLVTKHLESDDIPPSLFVAPADIEMAIEQLALNPVYRKELGEQARQFVSSRWDLTHIAERYLKLLNDEIPSEWWCNPASVQYLLGCGLPEERTRRMVSLLIKHYGASSLQVQDKPALEASLIALADCGDELDA